MKYESQIWALIAVLAVIVTCVQTQKLNTLQSRNDELELINQSQKLALEGINYDQTMAQ